MHFRGVFFIANCVCHALIVSMSKQFASSHVANFIHSPFAMQILFQVGEGFGCLVEIVDVVDFSI